MDWASPFDSILTDVVIGDIMVVTVIGVISASITILTPEPS